MGLYFVPSALSERRWPSAAQAIPFRLTVPSRSERTFFNNALSRPRAPPEPSGRAPWRPLWSACARGRSGLSPITASQALINFNRKRVRRRRQKLA